MHAPRGAARSVVPERLLSLLDKAKAYPLFQKNYPDALEGVLHATPNTTNYYDNFKLSVRDVWRFEEEDTLVFRIELENPSDTTIYRYGDFIGRRPKSSHAGNREGTPGGPIHRPEFSGPNARAAPRLSPGTGGRVELPAIQTLCATSWPSHCGIESLFVLLHQDQLRADKRAAEGVC
jgi:hypothetical protein